MKSGDVTTIDLMYSFENQNKVVFQNDTIKRMTQKLKTVKSTARAALDPESEQRISNFI